MNAKALLVDDDQDMLTELKRALGKRGFTVVTAPSAEEAEATLAREPVDIVVTDINMKGATGLALCERIVDSRKDLPVIVVTGFGSIETAIATMRAGAFDFLTKPFQVEQLVHSMTRALEHFSLAREVARLRRDAEERARLEEMTGASAPMLAVYEMIERVAMTDATVLVTGESGTGKELVARAIHKRSRRAAGPLVAINCAAVPEALLESELFGHAKGAFTDAKSARRGLFVEASGGTLFLDELGEMPLGMQAKLLRALEERKVRPVGGSEEIEFDVRVVAATNRDLETLVTEKKFREDLFYRVNVVHVDLPPLRSRGQDVLLLTHLFIQRMNARHGKAVTGLCTAAAERLLAYDWPGNVRELLNCIERSVALATGPEITVADLPPKVRDFKASTVSFGGTDPAELVTLEELEHRYIRRVMETVQWNKTEATRVLGIDRSTLYHKLDRYDIKGPT